ncbi:tetratricopeptide repeat protein, partial [Ramlibacter sp.]|uniref:tetratricopeptide repeat protein n=1 Tax=Ramlibacter sp. TaxID=1917967 RepID=UPI0035ADB5DB
ANHAAALVAAGRPAQAEPLLREAIAIAPDAVDLQASLAVVLRALDRPREAEALLREALTRQPAHIPARLGLAILLLAEGRFQEAWPLYEARHEGPAPASGSPPPPDAALRWTGGPLAGGTLVIWHEQGFGDAIQFIRYAALAKARAGGRVVVSCPASLAALFATADGVDAVFTQPSACPPLAAWTWLGDLPRLLGTTLDSIPAPLPYLHADPARQAQWAGRLPPGRRAGLVWKGRADYSNDAHRSLPGLMALAPLWQVAGWSFVSLQKGPGAEDAMDPPDAQPLHALGHDLQDFADAAAVIAQLDLVITVDTAVAHLAGALGKPVWVLLPAQGTDWRWMSGRADSPWYPGVMRLFRQRQPLAWAEVVSEVAQALAGHSPATDHPAAPAGTADAAYQRGNALRDAGRWREAAAAYHEAIAIHPGHAGAHHNLGVVRQALGDKARAMAAYRRALERVPDHAITLTNLGSLLLEAGELTEAEPLLRAAIQAQPDYAKPRLYLADLLARRQAPEAEAAYQVALACDPGWAQALSHWGAWLTRAGRWAEAEASLRAALDRDPASVEAWINLAALLGDRHRAGESEAAWHEALKRAPGHPRARLGLGLHLLRQGRFTEAWPFHAARQDPVFRHFGTTPPTPPWPRWSGEPLQGRSLVIWPEQGHGDLLQFIRYAPLLKGLGLVRLTVLCRPELADLARSVDGVDDVVTSEAVLPAHDLWALLMDLPERLGTTLATLPARLPYLRADETRRARWQALLPAGPRIGLVWRGRPAHDNDAHRSLASLGVLAPLWVAAGGRAQFISLQKGAGEAEALSPPASQPLLALGHRIADFADAAAVVDGLDLVITVDTAMAHLAGGMGKPTWVLLPAHGCDWRWFNERADSPWYPGVMRLFRQPLDEPGWAGTVERMASELGRWLDGRPASATEPERRAALMSALGHQSVAEAEAVYRKALAGELTHADIHHNLANFLRQQRQLDKAEAQYRLALQVDPRHLHALTNLGTLLAIQRRTDEAESLLREALAMAPDSVDILSNLGTVLDDNGQHEKAEALYQRALAIHPDHAPALSNLGSLMMHQGRLEEAERHIRRALTLQPRMADALVNLGFVLRARGRLQEAEAVLREALAIDPGSALAQLNLCFVLLAQGRLREAWPLHGARLQPQRQQSTPTAPSLPWPQWRGEPLQGRSLVIWPEQGLGDAIQFVRYSQALKQLGLSRLTVVCQPALAPLLRTLKGVDHVETNVSAIEPHDYWVLLMDLPERFDTTPETIPAELPYLWTDPARVARWSARLPAGRRIGIVWRGSPGHRNDAHRSLPGLATLAPLWKVRGLQFISLQKGAGEAEAAQPPEGQPLVDLGRDFADFADAAAVVSQLDLVICVDTSVAHLAGALGKPVWLLLPRLGTDWRWLTDRDDSPWYPGVMRLFRQPLDEPGWAGTVERMAGELGRWLDARPAPVAASSPAEGLFHRAALMGAAGDHAGAEAAYRQGLALQPDHVGALNNLGLLLAHRGALAEAGAVYRRGLAAEPAQETLLLNLGTLLGDLRRTDEAEALLRRAAQARPTHAKPLNNLGRLLARTGRMDEAEAAYREAIALDAAHQSAARTNLAILLARSGRFDEAEALAREAVTRQPEVAEHWLGLGSVLRHARRDGEAEAALRRALALQPAHATAQLALSHLLLAQGRFEEGFALHGARRLWRPGAAMAAAPDLPWPEWTGQPFAGRSIVVWQEQGLGDALQFVRFASLLKPLGAKAVTLHCHPALAPLMRGVAGVDQVITRAQDCPPHDYWVLMLDLPRLLGTTVDRIPANLPYLQADAQRVARWSPRLPAGLRVGLVWRGAPGQENDDLRSLPGLQVLAPLWQVPGVQFVSLQKGEGEAQALQPPAGQSLTALGHTLEDMSDTAAVVSQLDLVITVCTSVAHLAGALGKPTWVLLPAIGADWRWLQDRDDSPWYPGVMRLFRGQVPGRWEPLIEAVRDALAAWRQARG